jgi:tetratricopeptide (TPR) repeat protein
MVQSDSGTSTTSSHGEDGRRLDSWKEIAAYLQRDVTTVRRWEKREGLPVHRHRHAALGSVYAFTNEIDSWQRGRERADRYVSPMPLAIVRPPLVGRHAELARLGAHLSKALAGRRQTVFITGELGIGKTALAQTFLDSLPSDVWVAAGQCVEQYGASEPYRPVIDGLERICRDPRYPEAARVIQERAPSWLDQISLPARGRRRGHGRRSDAPGADWMAGELTAALEALAAVKPLVVLLEDLHWSDHSTVQLIAGLSRRPDALRLLVVGTYRPAELFESGSPLLRVCRELRAHFQADEIELSLLHEEAVAELIARDRTWHDLSAAAARLRHWSGNPLFLVHLLEHLENSGHLLARNGDWVLDHDLDGRTVLPRTLRSLVEEQIDRLDAGSRRLVEIASVVGEVFAAAAVADAADQTVPAVEQSFEDLCRRSRLVSRREWVKWPDGVFSSVYAFVHEFCRQVLYERLPSATLRDFHRRIGTRLELAYVDRVQEISSELASHFERGHDFERAARYYAMAADTAVARNADREAQIGLSKASELIAELTPGESRNRLELDLRVKLRAAAEKVSADHVREESAIEEGIGLLDGGEKPPELVTSLIHLARSYAIHGDTRAAREFGDRAARIARRENRNLFGAISQQADVRLLTGEFSDSRTFALEALMLADARGIAPDSTEGRIRCLSVAAQSSWYLGRFNEARVALARISDLSVTAPRTANLTAAEVLVAPIHERLGDTERSLDLARTRRFVGRASSALVCATKAVRGWLLARRGRRSAGIALLRGNADTLKQIGAIAYLPQTFAWLAEALHLNGQSDAARAAAEEGLDIVRRTGARACDAELYRLRGEAMLASTRSPSATLAATAARDAAEASFWAGISVARQQQASALELQITLSLCRLLVESERVDEAKRMLLPLCEPFSGEFETPDLMQARRLLSAGLP